MNNFNIAGAAALTALSFLTAQTAAADDWSGAYVGATIGASAFESETTNAVGSDFTVSGGGVVAGLYGGYAWNMSGWVIGVEADFQIGTLEDSAPVAAQDYFITENGRASVRLVAGMPVNKYLIYGTAGFAAVDLDQQYRNPASTIANERLSGYTAGLGIKRAFGAGWEGKVEYMYSSYEAVTFECSICGPSDNDYATHTISLGVAKRF